MNRRGFLGSILALGAAPAIVRADSLMRVVPVETTVLRPGTLGTLGGVQFYESDLDAITRESLRIAANGAFLVDLIPRIYDEQRTVRLRSPNRYIRRSA